MVNYFAKQNTGAGQHPARPRRVDGLSSFLELSNYYMRCSRVYGLETETMERWLTAQSRVRVAVRHNVPEST